MTFQKLVTLLLAVGTAQSLPEHPQKRASSYDYVIVGGGTAGLTLANRLSANSQLSVAVIEAGTQYEVSNPVLDSTPAGDVVGCGAQESPNPFVDWGFITEPMPGTNGRTIRYARGKCLGGSSARNFMIYQRGTKESYQRWADAVGDSSYTFDNLLPYFKASPTFTAPGPSRAGNASAGYQAAAFDNSRGGPLQVSYANYASPFSSYIEGSLNEIGVPQTTDFNSGSLLGAQYCASTIRPQNENRESSETSFLEAAKSRTNLAVFSNTLAKQILFDSNKKATGVSVTTGGLPYVVSANKEVIIAAGAFQSPQLLMVSGIGPASQLAANGISSVKTLAGVGQNMIDHVFAGPTYRVNVETLTKSANDPGYLAAQYLGPYQQGQGVLTNPVCDFLGWEKVPQALRQTLPQSILDDLATFPDDWPEIEYISAPGYVGDFANLFASQPKDGYQYATILGTLVAPLSRGNVTIKSKDTNDLPIIQPNWLDHPSDQAVMVAAYKRVRQAFASNFMAATLVDRTEYFPGPQVQTDEQILQVIKNTVMTVWHASGTCKMGQASDPTAVVDSNFRVFGVSGLRVVDASVFPLLPPGHPQSTIYMLGEKASADILAGR
ncbi:hypothetical protein AMS68_006139 [Peltaster fructicola]|uniref:Glucose-methanol-choline oxidoreductase N-terminal domain-containing protein n=1 Tax=Peltaster fructicola TaxID=286661 RepID=A0A6H0Y0R5_9PEZI|nr:hypothetical protein AMS68_006139 [Peltaster fructicola]